MIETVNSTIQSSLIGEQEWATFNLNLSEFRNGNPIPEAKTDAHWERAGEEQKPAWCYFNNDPANDKKYGKLYNWYAVNDLRGLAPKGWHLPTDEEWSTLINYLGNEAGGKMKSSDEWVYGADNSSGFLALPASYRYYLGNFYILGNDAAFWSSTGYSNNFAWYRYLSYAFSNVYTGYAYKGCGFSCRCIKDKSIILETGR